MVGHTSRSLTTVRSYLQTTAEREDIATPQEWAIDIPFLLPAAVLAEALDIATRTAIATGHGEAVLLALTGRAELPPSFSVV